jgi:hypothetical protein
LNASRILFEAAFIGLAFLGPAHAELGGISPAGQRLVHQLDEMGVETKWIAGVHVDWETGLPDGRPETSAGRHTHCSAFVAAAAKRLGVYILRPPEHGQVMLANAQNEWLAEEGPRHGWRPVDGPVAAQDLANRGMLAVATYHNRRDDKPGHIAIVRPSVKTAQEIEADGPAVIQAGTANSAAVSLRLGFAGHVHAWSGHEVDFYAHAVSVFARPMPQ